MTNTAAPRQTAREQIAAVAAENGWTRTVESTTDRYTRGELRIVVAFAARGTGAVKWAERRRPSTSGNAWIVRDAVSAEDRGKRETVIGWLTVPASGDEQTAETEQAPEASQTAREQIAAVAAENGWTKEAVDRGRMDRYQRGEITVTVIYAATGRVTEAERLVGLVQRGYVWKRDSGKRETVIEWLTESVEQAPTTYRCELCGEDVRGQDQPTHMDERHTAPEQDPAGIPTVDEVADAIADGTWAAAPQAPEVVSVEILEAEADAQDAPSLDDAARDQALGSLDRLEEILPPVLEAAGSGYGFKALVRDHLLIVRGRIAELEAQAARMLDTALVAQNDWNAERSRLNLRIAELEGRDAAAQEMLARAVTIERERDDYAATLVRVTDRNAELVAERDRVRKVADDERVRIADLERETERLAGVDMAAAEAQKRIAELERERDDERIRGDQLAESIAELERRLEDREDQVVGYQQSLGQRNARVAELKSVISKLTGATIAVDQAWRDHLDVIGDPQD